MNASNVASSFSEIRKLKASYINKTERIYNLVSSVNRRLFLSRPRRFGKTLLIDILEEIFKGNKKLFKGLAIYDKNYDWKSYPVIRMSLSRFFGSSVEELNVFLIELMKNIVSNHNIDLKELMGDYVVSAGNILHYLIGYYAKQNKKVVILIDEYDYPVMNNITSPTVDKLRETLKGFYSVLKDNSKNIHFEFLTGVTKLAYTTIFSGVNDVKDISSSEKFSDLLGYTQKELENYFSSIITKVCKTKKLQKKKFLSDVKEWYDGYRFSKKKLTVYNPSSINLFFQENCDFSMQWITTGTSEFLIKVLSDKPSFKLEKELSKRHFDFLTKNTLVVPKYNIVNLLYQTGYITVTDYDPDTNTYKLDYPNKEVAGSFNLYLIEAIFGISEYDLTSKVDGVVSSLKNNDIDAFVDNLNNILTSIASTPQKYQENSFQLSLAIILGYMIPGFEVYSEQTGFKGRSDVVAISKDHIYIIELKVDKKAEVGMRQMKEKQYYLPYLNNKIYKKKGITLIALSFNSKTKEVKNYLVETIR